MILSKDQIAILVFIVFAILTPLLYIKLKEWVNEHLPKQIEGEEK